MLVARIASVLLCTCLIAVPAVSHTDVHAELSPIMKNMKKAFRDLKRAPDAAAMKLAFIKLKENAAKAAAVQPQSVQDKKLSSEQMQAYRTAVEDLHGLVDAGLAALEAGDEAEARAAGDKIASLRNKSHDYLGVE